MPRVMRLATAWALGGLVGCGSQAVTGADASSADASSAGYPDGQPDRLLGE